MSQLWLWAIDKHSAEHGQGPISLPYPIQLLHPSRVASMRHALDWLGTNHSSMGRRHTENRKSRQFQNGAECVDETAEMVVGGAR